MIQVGWVWTDDASAPPPPPPSTFWNALTGQSGLTGGGDIREMGFSFVLMVLVKEIAKCLSGK